MRFHKTKTISAIHANHCHVQVRLVLSYSFRLSNTSAAHSPRDLTTPPRWQLPLKKSFDRQTMSTMSMSNSFWASSLQIHIVNVESFHVSQEIFVNWWCPNRAFLWLLWIKDEDQVWGRVKRSVHASQLGQWNCWRKFKRLGQSCLDVHLVLLRTLLASCLETESATKAIKIFRSWV